jgi:hypothetical protein
VRQITRRRVGAPYLGTVTECRNLSCGEKTVGSGDCAQRDETCFGTVLTISGAPASTAESKVALRRGAEVLSYSARGSLLSGQVTAFAAFQSCAKRRLTASNARG